MGLFNWTFKKNKEEQTTNDINRDKVEIERLYQLDGDNRLRNIIEWGDKADNSKLRTIQYAILNDPDIGVKMAGLKRIHLFTDKECVRQFLTNDNTKEVGQKCEPYFSMALSRTGIISIEEFKRRVG
jgi:hypothetical protein